MTELTCDQFIEYVARWIEVDEANISRVWPTKGGWEGWAQVEICSRIVATDSRYQIEREQHPYGASRKASDFFLNVNCPVSQQVIIELKCQSFQNYANFGAGLQADVEKLTNEVDPQYRGATLLAMGIYFLDCPIPDGFQRWVSPTNEVALVWASL